MIRFADKTERIRFVCRCTEIFRGEIGHGSEYIFEKRD